MANFLQKIYNKIKSFKTPPWLRKAIHALWALLEDIITDQVESFLAQMKDVALDVCLDIQKDPSIITSDDKRKKAFERINKEAVKRGFEVKDNLTNWLIETVVLKLKKEF